MSMPDHAEAIAAAWRARLAGPTSEHPAPVHESAPEEDLVPAVAAFVKAGRIDDDCYEALEAAVLAAARKALAS